MKILRKVKRFLLAGSEVVICLRLSRVNHECDPNASQTFLDDFKVKVLNSEKDIKIGEEVKNLKDNPLL